MLSLNKSQSRKLSRVLNALTMSLNPHEVRENVGAGLLDLLQTDYFASVIWDQSQHRFTQRVALNMSPINLDQYDAYYQFHDPITHKLQRYTSSVSVSSVMPYRKLVKTEFYNDFLRRDGLYYGLNLYAYDGVNNIGDLRIWRARHRPDFDTEQLMLLNYIKPLFTNVMRNLWSSEKTSSPDYIKLNDQLLGQLTPRGLDVVQAVVGGLSDKVIARQLGISYSTVRTYINRLFSHFGVHSRTELIHHLIE